MQLRNSRRGFLAGSIAISATPFMPAAAATQLEIPLGPMVLMRKIVRDLRDGAQVIVTREWRITFARRIAGIEIDGKQISATVEAPDKMRAIAQIEEQRPTDGMFPILLNETGLIDQVGEIDDSASVEAAVRKAEELIAQLPRREDEKTRMRQAIARFQVASSSIFEVMPPDLFFPSNTKFEDARQLPLPDGSIGEFRLTYTAKHAELHPWLERADRHIVTQIGDDSRHSYEVWSLRSE